MVKLNPTWKEYFKVKEADGYVRGFYDHIADDIWVWRGKILHNFVKTYKKIPDDAWRFILETKIYTIFVEQHGKARMINKLKELEPQAKEGKGWIN